MQLKVDRRKSPIGTMLLVFNDEAVLYSLDFDDYASRMHKLLKRYYGPVQLDTGRASQPIVDALDAYFDGDLSALEGLEVGPGGTDFQRQVWSCLRGIPAGTTSSYGRLAVQTGRPAASRAVGLANGANPVAIVVPCHRVIGASGALTGFGGGLWRKRWLLQHERAIVSPNDEKQPHDLFQ